MIKPLRQLGLVLCLIAVGAASGGHWMLLQSAAWVRMASQYSQQQPLGTALSQTFDGENPCSWCLWIQDGRSEEERQKEKAPWRSLDRGPDLFPAAIGAGFVPWFTLAGRMATPPPDRYAGLLHTPPTPPPRA